MNRNITPTNGTMSRSTPVPQQDRVHRVELIRSTPAQATVVLHADTKAIFRDGELRIVWVGDEMANGVPLRGEWELTPQQAQAKGLCTVQFAADGAAADLAAVVTEMDDMIKLTGLDDRQMRMAERVRRMLVEALGGEAAVEAANRRPN